MCLSFLYRLIFRLITPFLLIRLWYRGKKNPAYRKHYWQRLGFTPNLNECLWLHAVSLGESIAATPLIEALLKQFPHIPLLVTNTTPTGRAHIERCFGNRVMQSYLPYDTPGAVKRFLKRTQPRIVIIMETELWPTLLDILGKKAIPCLIANARLSQRSCRNYRRLGRWFQGILKNVSLILTQSDHDAEHFKQIGAVDTQLIVAGNIKYDARLDPNLITRAQEWRSHWGERFTWIAASTHDGEEAQLIAAHKTILEKKPNALLLIAPRHPERFNAVAKLIHENDLSFCRRSKNEWPSDNHTVFLLDSLGELTTWYGCADVAFVAGSLMPIGGHNLVEPSLHKKPVISGPHLHNFLAMSKFMLKENALTVLKSSDAIPETILNYATHTEHITRDGCAAFEACQQHQGACDTIINEINKIIKNTY